MHLYYFLWSHRAHYLLLIVITLGVATRLWVQMFGRAWEDLPAILVFFPVIIGVSIAGSLHEPFGELALTLTANQWLNRCVLIVFGLMMGTTCLSLGLMDFPSSGVTAIVRNIVGFTGLACWMVVLFGPRLAWIPPTLLALVMYVSDSARQPDQLPNVLWAWALTLPENTWSWAISAALASGILVAIHRGPRQDLGPTEDM